MKSKSFRNNFWLSLICVSIACYGYLSSKDASDYHISGQTSSVIDENEDEAKVYLPDIALLKKIYDLAEGFLNR